MPSTVTFAVGSLVRARGREWVVLPESRQPSCSCSGRSAPPTTRSPGSFLRSSRSHPRRSHPRPSDGGRCAQRASAPRCAPARLPLQRRPVPLVRPHRRRPPSVPARAAADGAQARPGPAADRRRRRHRQDDRGGADRPRAARPGDAQRLAVLCPPHLAEQWQIELRDKFHLDAELVLAVDRSAARARPAASASRCSRCTRHVIVSTDFIKADRRRDDFVRACPELVIVDEAHTLRVRANRPRPPAAPRAATGARRRRASPPDPRHRHPAQRQGGRVPLTARAARPIASETSRTTSREHAGGRPSPARAAPRAAPTRRHRRLPRRGNAVPGRELARDVTYELSQDMRAAVRRRVANARATSSARRRRPTPPARPLVVGARAAALARLESAAAVATLRNRADNLDRPDRRGGRRARAPRRLDDAGDEGAESLDVAPGAARRGRRSRPRAAAERDVCSRSPRTRRRSPASTTRSSKPRSSSSRTLVKDGHHPIVFCRFIPTAEYVAEHLRDALGKTSRSRRHRLAPTGGARGADCRAVLPRAARARRHRLPQRGHQPPGTLRRRRSTTTSPGTRRGTSSARVASTATARSATSCAWSPSMARTSRSTASCSTCCCESTSASAIARGLGADAGRLRQVVDAILEGVIARGRDDIRFTSSSPCSARSAGA